MNRINNKHYVVVEAFHIKVWKNVLLNGRL